MAAHSADDLRAIGDELGDPFGGRRDSDRPSDVLVQIARDLPLYWSFSRSDLRAMAELTAETWRHVGVAEGSRIAFYDYATSPTVLFSSRSFVSHLDAGAADLLGCLPICNDGLPELAERCVHVLEYMRPSFLFVDNGLMEPLLRALANRRIDGSLTRVVVTGDEDPVDPGRLIDWSRSMGCEVVQVLRIDAALLLAPPCSADPVAFHPDERSYAVETWDEDRPRRHENGPLPLVVTNLALESTVVVRYATALSGTVSDGLCVCGRSGPRVVIHDVD